LYWTEPNTRLPDHIVFATQRPIESFKPTQRAPSLPVPLVNCAPVIPLSISAHDGVGPFPLDASALAKSAITANQSDALSSHIEHARPHSLFDETFALMPLPPSKGAVLFFGEDYA
jgi:hypothetical protein